MTWAGRLLLLAVVVLAGSRALALEPASAAEIFAEGERAFRQDDYVLALTRFREAMRLAPHEAVRFNIAVCLERLGRFREAFGEYEAVAQGAALDLKARQRASEQAARVKERLSTLVIDAPAVTASVGEQRCQGPCTLLLDPGTYQVDFETTPHTTTTVTLARGESRSVRPVLVPSPPAQPPASTFRLGVAGWLGAGATIIGGGLFVGFGVRAKTLHDGYLMNPTLEVRTEGVLFRDLANVSLGAGLAGLVVALLDLVWWSRAFTHE